LMDSGETDLMGYGGAFDEDNDNNRYHHHHNDDGMCEDDLGYDEVLDVDEGFVACCGSILSSAPTLLVCSIDNPLMHPPFLLFKRFYFALSSCFSEFFMNPHEWHMIRGEYFFSIQPDCPCISPVLQIPSSFAQFQFAGTAMVLAMKSISVAAPRSPHQKPLQMGFLRLSFLFESVVFALWFGFESYLHATQLIGSSSANPLWKDLLCTATSFATAIGCIIYSTYLSSIVYASYFLSFQWGGSLTCLLCAYHWVRLELTISVGSADGQMPMLIRRVLDTIITLSVSSTNSPTRLLALRSSLIPPREFIFPVVEIASASVCLDHRNESFHLLQANWWWVRGVNAYLAVIFDVSEEQDEVLSHSLALSLIIYHSPGKVVAYSVRCLLCMAIKCCTCWRIGGISTSSVTSLSVWRMLSACSFDGRLLVPPSSSSLSLLSPLALFFIHDCLMPQE
uniref:Transmembrane protein n=1 Tax=Taenia asiatica TaxID=60517 RepID=A0A0R3VS92_TAEAS